MFAQESVMDFQKEKEAFEKHASKFFKTNEAFEDDGENYVYDEVKFMWDCWLAAKAQAVPDTYTPIVLALEDVQSKIAKTSFLTMDEENENEVMAVNANELAAYIDELIEAQEPAND